MNIQSWMIKSWATLEWYLPAQSEQLPGFKHVGTQVRDDGSSSGFRAGDTVWVAQDEQWQAGLAWEWVEVRPGIVMLADPNSIITNLQFVDGANQHVYGLAKTTAVNRLVHGLPWQQSVCARLSDQVLYTLAAATALPQLQHAQGKLHSVRASLRSHTRSAMQTADVHALPSQGRRMMTIEPPRHARSRATDLEEGPLGLALQDLRRAA